jgi:hypothetical protein
MGYIPDGVIDALRGSYNIGLFFRLGTDPALHLWLGASDMKIGIPAFDAVGTKYLGWGRLRDLPDLETLINGLADVVTVSISGVSPEHAMQIAESTPPVLGARATIGFAPLDENYQAKSEIQQLWFGSAETWIMEQPVTKDGRSSPTRTLSVTMASGESGRARSALATFTDASQHLRFPTDDFFNRVSAYYVGKTLVWPVF